MNTNDSQAGTGKNSSNMTEEQVKQTILGMVDNGDKYREIAKVEFKVNGKLKHYNISAISKIVKERDLPPKQEDGNRDAAVTELFEDGKGPIDAVIELHLSMDMALELYNKYIIMKEVDLSDESTPRRIRELERKFNGLDPIEDLVEYMQGYCFGNKGETAPTASDICGLLLHAKDLNSLPIMNLGRASCDKCGTKGSFAVSYKCTNCDEEAWWGQWPEEE